MKNRQKEIHVDGESLFAKDLYMREVRQIERLSAEDLQRYVVRMNRAWQHPDNQWLAMLARDARERIVLYYQPYVIACAKAYARNSFGVDFLDLVQDGNCGLLQALTYGRFETVEQMFGLIRQRVRGEMFLALYRRATRVHVPEYLLCLAKQLYRAEQQLAMTLGREPQIEELARYLGVTERKVVEARNAYEVFAGVHSLQALVEGDEEERRDDELGFVSLYQGAYGQEGERERRLEQAFQQALEQVLTPRQREVIALRYGVGGSVGGGYSQERTAAMLGVSSIEKIERGAKKRLREALASLVESEVS